MQRNSLHQHEEFDESAIPVENSQHLRLLYQIREVLQRRNSLHQNVYTGTQMETSPRSVLSSVPQPATILQPDYNSSTNACPRHCENCGSNQQLSYLTQLMQNMRIGQNLNNLVSQHETESGLFKASPPTAATTQMPSQEAPTVRTSKITLFRKMRHKPGFGHLREDTHVLVEAKGTSRVECRTLIEKAKKRIADMFTPEFDSLKREQLIHLAMLNGTYRQSLPSPKSST
ncbi:hypothetical protein GCK32_005540 [Trichostrongylus colubriformis]|uniref:Uncharacterized protein n=1 Tax=Trichostrongylus colubriformis TaxID=6319 RepID=A0AAN8J2P7_TRICO